MIKLVNVFLKINLWKTNTVDDGDVFVAFYLIIEGWRYYWFCWWCHSTIKKIVVSCFFFFIFDLDLDLRFFSFDLQKISCIGNETKDLKAFFTYPCSNEIQENLQFLGVIVLLVQMLFWKNQLEDLRSSPLMTKLTF